MVDLDFEPPAQQDSTGVGGAAPSGAGAGGASAGGGGAASGGGASGASAGGGGKSTASGGGGPSSASAAGGAAGGGAGTGGGLPIGNACVDGSECQSGHCVDQTCCDGPCSGPCLRCDFANATGTCTTASQGSDPDNDCGLYQCGGATSCFTSCMYSQSALWKVWCKSRVCKADNTCQ
jgi:hypothetical protein